MEVKKVVRQVSRTSLQGYHNSEPGRSLVVGEPPLTLIGRRVERWDGFERLRYDAATAQVTYRSDKAEGPTAGSETVDALEFLARLVTHIPDRGQVLTRYCGWYANRTRGMRRRTGGADAAPPVEVAAPVPLPLREARRRWAELLRRIFEVDPLVCPRCGGAMRILAFLTEPAVIDRILTHLRTRSPPAPVRDPPSLTRRSRATGTAQRA